MAREDGWVRSKVCPPEVLALSDTKAHILLRNFTRHRADDSVISTGSALDVFEKTDAGWKVAGVSAVIEKTSSDGSVHPKSG